MRKREEIRNGQASAALAHGFDGRDAEMAAAYAGYDEQLPQSSDAILQGDRREFERESGGRTGRHIGLWRE
jgi:hypothetical protein